MTSLSGALSLALFWSASGVGLLSLNVAAQTLRIATGNAPPYQLSVNDTIIGKTVDVVKCVMEKTHTPYEMTIFPWRRALRLLSTDEVDMLFSLSKQLSSFDERHASAPIVLEKWYWITREEGPIDVGSTISVVAGSSEEYWLKKQDYERVFAVPSLGSAIKMLNSGRADAVLSDANKVEPVLLLSPLIESGWHKEFVKFDTQAVYFSKKLINNNPTYLKDFNLALVQCNPVGTGLDPQERAILKGLAQQLHFTVNDTLLLNTVKSSQTSSKEFEAINIDSLEADWLSHSDSTPSALVNSITTSLLSKHLKEQSPFWSSVITEIIVTDNMGQTIAASKIPTDYWQGDEDNFKVVSLQKNGSHHISPVYFDESTGQFQIQISFKIDNSSEGFEGVIIFGIDLEKAYLTFH